MTPRRTAVGRASVIALAALVSSSLTASAQEISLTLDQAIERAVAWSPQIAQTENQVSTAHQSELTSIGRFLPSLSARSGASRSSSSRFDPNTNRVVEGSSSSYNAGINAGLTIYQGGQRVANLAAARADVVAAEANVERQRFAVIQQTKTLFFQALRQGELLEVARARLERAEQSLEFTRLRLEGKQATVSDTLRAKLEVTNARQALLESESAERGALIALARQIGTRDSIVPVRPDDLDPTPLALLEEEILRIAEEESPTVLAAVAAVEAAGASARASRSGYLPSLSGSWGYSWANQEASFSGGNRSWSLGLSMSYSLFDGFSREVGVDRADNQLRIARLQEEDSRLAAREQADQAYRALLTAEQAIALADESVIVAREDLRVTNDRYRFGAATILDVVTSQVALQQAEADRVNARYAYVNARAALEAILGRPL